MQVLRVEFYISHSLNGPSSVMQHMRLDFLKQTNKHKVKNLLKNFKFIEMTPRLEFEQENERKACSPRLVSRQVKHFSTTKKWLPVVDSRRGDCKLLGLYFSFCGDIFPVAGASDSRRPTSGFSGCMKVLFNRGEGFLCCYRCSALDRSRPEIS